MFQNGVPRIIAVLCYLFNVVQGITILAFTDSFDRYVIEDRCPLFGEAIVPWTDERFTYIDRKPGGLSCTINLPHTNTTVFNLNVFGSNATRPYHIATMFESNPHNIIDTKDRIHYGLHLFLQKYPPPDILLFHTGAWDLQYFSAQGNLWYTVNTIGHEDFNRAVSHARNNYIERMQELNVILKNYGAENITRVGLRTASYYPSRYNDVKCEKDVKYLTEAYNDMVRELSRERNLTLFDLDADAWSTTRYTYSRCDVLRDRLHLSAAYSITYGKKLLGARHSAFYFLRGTQPVPAELNISWLHPKTKHVQKEVYLVKIVPPVTKQSDIMGNSGPRHNHFQVPGSSLQYFSNDSLMMQYLLEEEAYAKDLYFVSYDETGQNPLLHSGAGVHFQLLFRLGEGDIYEATAAEIQEVRRGHSIPAALNAAEVSYHGAIVHIPIKHAEQVISTSSSSLHSDARDHIHGGRNRRHHLRHRRLAGSDGRQLNNSSTERSASALSQRLAIYDRDFKPSLFLSPTGNQSLAGNPTNPQQQEKDKGDKDNGDSISVCDEWYLLVQWQKHPLNLIPDYTDRCRDVESRMAAPKVSLQSVYNRLDKVPQLVGRERSRIYHHNFLSILPMGDAIYVPT